MYVLKLFIGGMNPEARQLVQDCDAILKNNLSTPYSLEVIDLLKHPHLAAINKVEATPTLIKEYPPPYKKMVGPFNKEKILLELGLS